MPEEIKNETVNETVEVETKPEPTKEKSVAESSQDVQTQLQNMMVEMAKLKRANDKLASENADVKRKWKATLSEQELASQEKAEREVEREEQFAKLLRENNINKAEKTYLSLGYTAEESTRMAVAEVDNDFETRTKIMAEVDARKKKDYESEWLKSRPSVNVGVGNENAPITKEQFDKLGYKDIVDFKNKYPETYKAYSKN